LFLLFNKLHLLLATPYALLEHNFTFQSSWVVCDEDNNIVVIVLTVKDLKHLP